MANPSKSIHRVLRLEGHESYHEDDPGGETTWGISRVHFPEMYEDGPPDWRDAKKFYSRRFWEPLQLDKVHDQAVADEVLDQAVNLGKKRAVLLWQYATNLTLREGEIAVDGVVGPETLGTTNRLSKADTRRVVKVMNGLQFCYYLYRTDNWPRAEELFDTLPRADQDVFFRGWMNRIDLTDMGDS